MKNAAMLLLASLLFSAALNAQFTIMKVDGIKGESTRAKFKDWIEISGFILDVSVPQTATGGAASGRRIHQPLVVLKNSDGSSPQFFSYLSRNKRIKEIKIEYYKRDVNGMDVLDYSITLEDVLIAGYKQFSGPLKNERFDPKRQQRSL